MGLLHISHRHSLHIIPSYHVKHLQCPYQQQAFAWEGYGIPCLFRNRHPKRIRQIALAVLWLHYSFSILFYLLFIVVVSIIPRKLFLGKFWLNLLFKIKWADEIRMPWRLTPIDNGSSYSLPPYAMRSCFQVCDCIGLSYCTLQLHTIRFHLNPEGWSLSCGMQYHSRTHLVPQTRALLLLYIPVCVGIQWLVQCFLYSFSFEQVIDESMSETEMFFAETSVPFFHWYVASCVCIIILE